MSRIARHLFGAGMPLLGVTVVLAVIVATMGGCSGTGPGTVAGTLQIGITDASSTFAKVVLSVSAIRAVPVGAGYEATGTSMPLVAQFSPARTVDVLSLHYVQQALGVALLPEGTYEQLRLVLAPNLSSTDPANYVTLASDPTTKIPLQTPSGQQTGLKILGRFLIQGGRISAVLLDFDPNKAIVQEGVGAYEINPTGVRIAQVQPALSSFGSLSGTVTPAGAQSSAMVFAIAKGSTAAVAAGSVDPDDGSFTLFVPPGTYFLNVTATGYAAYDSSALSTPVYYDVTAGADESAGTVALQASSG